jgi:hypothetical protein
VGLGRFIAKKNFFFSVRHWWLMFVILATQEAEIRRITVRSQLRHIMLKTLS